MNTFLQSIAILLHDGQHPLRQHISGWIADRDEILIGTEQAPQQDLCSSELDVTGMSSTVACARLH